MKNIAVIYKSKYGTTKQYAEWIAEELDASLFEASSIKSSSMRTYDVVIYGGGLYAGGIIGVKHIIKSQCKSLIVFTVGVADPAVSDYSEILAKNFTQELLSKIKIFHFRGGINYPKLGFIHKTMMAVVKKSLEKKNESERTDEDRALLETYGTEIDFSDKSTIMPLIESVRAL